MSQSIRIIAFQLHPLLALGLDAIVKNQPNWEYRGNLSDPDALEEQLRHSFRPKVDMLFVDFTATNPSAIQWIHHLKPLFPELKMAAFLSTRVNEIDMLGVLRLELNAYLFHSANPEDVVKAIQIVMAGQAYMEPHLTTMVLEQLRKPAVQVHEAVAAVALTQREKALLQLAVDGLSNTQIADLLALQEKTVRNLWSNLFEKTGTTDKTQAVLWAIRGGYAEVR